MGIAAAGVAAQWWPVHQVVAAAGMAGVLGAAGAAWLWWQAVGSFAETGS